MISFRIDVVSGPKDAIGKPTRVFRVYSEIGCMGTRTDPAAAAQLVELMLRSPDEYSRGVGIKVGIIDRKRAASGERDDDAEERN